MIRREQGRAFVSAGSEFTSIIRADGTLWAWGGNIRSQVGISGGIKGAPGEQGAAKSIGVPSPGQKGRDSDWAFVASGINHSAVIKNNGTLWAWGSNNQRTLGDGTDTRRLDPFRIGTDADWAYVSVGMHTLAVKTDGTLWAWGVNEVGRLGLGRDVSGRSTPAQVGTDSDWAFVVAGDGHSLAVKKDGSLWAWGDNRYGQLGLSAGARFEPTEVQSGTRWVYLSSRKRHSMGIREDGTLWAWGAGQLGNGETVRTLTEVIRRGMVQVGTDTNWASVAAGSGYSLAIKTDGSLWGWGDNLANGSGQREGSTPTPARIGRESNWAFVSAGDFHSVAVKTDGSLWAWGLNRGGQVGDGTHGRGNDRLNPVEIKPGSTMSAFASRAAAGIIGAATGQTQGGGVAGGIKGILGGGQAGGVAGGILKGIKGGGTRGGGGGVVGGILKGIKSAKTKKR